MQRTIFYNISTEYNCFFWLPPKTASHTLSWIMTYFKFEHYEKVPDGNELGNAIPVTFHYNHDFVYPPNHQNKIFVCSIRNPYDRFFSLFKNLKYRRGKSVEDRIKPTKQDFEEFCNNIFDKKEPIEYFQPIFSERVPDYFVKFESIYEDLIKIPFIGNSNLNKCGILEEMCNRRINPSLELSKDEYFDEEIKNKIYEFFKDEFSIGGYEK